MTDLCISDTKDYPLIPEGRTDAIEANQEKTKEYYQRRADWMRKMGWPADPLIELARTEGIEIE